MGKKATSRVTSKEKMVISPPTPSPVRSMSTRLSKQSKEQKIRELLVPMDKDPPPNAVNVARRVVDLELEIAQAKRTKKPELREELNAALQELEELAAEYKKNNLIDASSRGENMIDTSFDQDTDNYDMMKELDAIDDMDGNFDSDMQVDDSDNDMDQDEDEFDEGNDEGVISVGDSEDSDDSMGEPESENSDDKSEREFEKIEGDFSSH